MPPPYDALLGPVGVTIGALFLVGFLGRLVFKYIDRIIVSLEARIVDLTSQRDIALAGWREQTAATNRLSDAVEKLAPRR